MKKINHILSNHLRRTTYEQQTAHEQTIPKQYLHKLTAKYKTAN